MKRIILNKEYCCHASSGWGCSKPSWGWSSFLLNRKFSSFSRATLIWYSSSCGHGFSASSFALASWSCRRAMLFSHEDILGLNNASALSSRYIIFCGVKLFQCSHPILFRPYSNSVRPSTGWIEMSDSYVSMRFSSTRLLRYWKLWIMAGYKELPLNLDD